MKQLIVCSASDAHRLVDMVKRITTETTILLSAGEADQEALSRLATGQVSLYRGYNCDDRESRGELIREMKGLKRAYFVISNPVMSSSALQAMCYSLYPYLLQVDCWKITLEPVKRGIPLGFAFMRNLPEGLPYETKPHPLNSLLRRMQTALTA